MKTFNEHVDALANTIVATRDFCGDEGEAIKEYRLDNGFALSLAWMQVLEAGVERANEIWRGK